MPIVQVLWNSQSQESKRGHPLSLGGSKRLALPLSKPLVSEMWVKSPEKGQNGGFFTEYATLLVMT